MDWSAVKLFADVLEDEVARIDNARKEFVPPKQDPEDPWNPPPGPPIFGGARFQSAYTNLARELQTGSSWPESSDYWQRERVSESRRSCAVALVALAREYLSKREAKA